MSAERPSAVHRQLHHVGEADLQAADARAKSAEVVIPCHVADVQNIVVYRLQPSHQLAKPRLHGLHRMGHCCKLMAQEDRVPSMLACMSEMLLTTSGPRVPPKAGMAVAGANWRWNWHTSCRSLGRRTLACLVTRGRRRPATCLASQRTCSAARMHPHAQRWAPHQKTRAAEAHRPRPRGRNAGIGPPSDCMPQCCPAEAAAEPACVSLPPATEGLSCACAASSTPAEPPSRHLHRRRRTPPAARWPSSSD